jgi:signal transduction histidine kinase
VDVDASAEQSNHPLLAGHPVILVAQIVRAALFGIAAAGFMRRAERTHDRLIAWLAVGSVCSAVAGVNYFLYPSLFTDYVYTGDVFRLLFYVIVLVAAESEVRSYWRRAAEAAKAAERQRLARDLHDGLAQELAAIRRNLSYLDREDRAVARAMDATDRALGASRGALATLDDAPGTPLRETLETVARRVGEREGVPVSVRVARGVEVDDPQQRDALVMIASEAITNAARHGGAGSVRVEVCDAGRPCLRVADDGAGFDAHAIESDGHYGLRTMRARASAIGGSLTVDSRLGRGTIVEVVL